MYSGLPPPKNPSIPKPALKKENQEVPGAIVEEEWKERPEEVHGTPVPEWVRPPRCALVLEEHKDDVILSRIPLHAEAVYVIGREVADVDVPMLHPTISRKHAMLVHGTPPGTPAGLRASGVTLLDLKGASGTFFRAGLAGRRRQLAPGSSVVLRDEMVFQFGGSSRMYRVTGTKEPVIGGEAVQGRARLDAAGSLATLLLAQEEGDASIAFPKEMHKAVAAKLRQKLGEEEKPGSRAVAEAFRSSTVLNDTGDLAPQAATLNPLFVSSVLGKRGAETAFSGQASSRNLQDLQTRERTRLLQRTQGHVAEGPGRQGVQQLIVEPSAGPGARVALAVQERGENKRLALAARHLASAAEALEKEDSPVDGSENLVKEESGPSQELVKEEVALALPEAEPPASQE